MHWFRTYHIQSRPGVWKQQLSQVRSLLSREGRLLWEVIISSHSSQVSGVQKTGAARYEFSVIGPTYFLWSELRLGTLVRLGSLQPHLRCWQEDQEQTVPGKVPEPPSLRESRENLRQSGMQFSLSADMISMIQPCSGEIYFWNNSNKAFLFCVLYFKILINII